MKGLAKRTSKLILIFVMICPMFSIPVYAWAGTGHFTLSIALENIPDGTVYVDLLMPISEGSEAYIAYNEQSGKKYQIKENSQIVRYAEDGFVSYSFHCNDAESLISLDSTAEDVQIAETSYCTDGRFNMWYCCDHFKQAKAAYINSDGKILAVSNAVDIDIRQWFDSGNSFFVGFQLSGNDLTVTFYRSPFNILYFVEIAGIVLFASCTLILIATELVRQRKYASKADLMNRSLKATCIVQGVVLLIWVLVNVLNIANQIFLFTNPDTYVLGWLMNFLMCIPLGAASFALNLMTYKEDEKNTGERNIRGRNTAIAIFLLFSLTKSFVYFSATFSFIFFLF